MKLSARTKKGRVFYKYLVSYFLILLIPVVMSFFLFNRASSVLTEEANRANNLLLNQIKSYFDMIMSDVQKLHYLVGYNDRMEGLLYKKRPAGTDEYYRAYQVVKDLRVYDVATTSIEDFYVYLPGLDMVVSPNGYFTTRSYHNAWMRRLDVSFPDWLDEFAEIDRIHYSSGRIETKTDAVVDTVRAIYPLPTSDQTGMPRGWLCVNVRADLFAQVLAGTEWTEESIVLVYHEEFGIIASSKNDIPNTVPASIHRDSPGHQATVRLDGSRYVLLSKPSDVTAWSYVSLVPLNIYSDRFTDLSRFTIVAFIVCMALGGAVIYWFAVARYRPVHSLLQLLRPNSGGTVSLQSDEFAVITASLEMTLAEDKLLRQEVKRTQPIVAGRYLQQLLRGRIADSGQARTELEGLGVALPFSHLTFVLIDVEGAAEFSVETSEEGFRLAMLGLGSARIEVLRDLQGTVGILVNHSGLASSAIADALLEQKRAAESAQPVVWSIGVSETLPVDFDLSRLYRQARRALDFRLVKGRDAPILYERIRSSNQSYYYPVEQETKLMNSIRAGDAETAAAIVEDIYNQNFTDTPLSLEMARCLMFDLIATMVKTLNSIVTREEDAAFWSRVKPITRLTECNSFEHLKNEIGSTLSQTCRYVRDHRTSHTDQLRRDILDYIHEHYSDPNLCTDVLADALKKNPAYLARFFREQMHIGMSTYIKKHRVDAAKRVLRHEDITLNELAARVGFAGSNALIRAFKDVEGITPGQFREAITA